MLVYIFVLTLGVTILNLLKIFSIMIGNPIQYPEYKQFGPTSWWILYPSFFYQVYWWVNYLNLL